MVSYSLKSLHVLTTTWGRHSLNGKVQLLYKKKKKKEKTWHNHVLNVHSIIYIKIESKTTNYIGMNVKIDATSCQP